MAFVVVKHRCMPGSVDWGDSLSEKQISDKL